jgi:hypothetical protein
MGGKPCFLRVFSISAASCVANGSAASGADVSVVYTSARGSEGTTRSDPCGDNSTPGATEPLATVLERVEEAAQLAKEMATRRVRRQTVGCDERAMGELDPSKPSKKAAGQLPGGLRA